MQQIVPHTLEILDGWPGREVAGPEGVRVTRIREEIVALGGPLEVQIVQSLQVARGRRVNQIVRGSVTLVRISKQLCAKDTFIYQVCAAGHIDVDINISYN